MIGLIRSGFPTILFFFQYSDDVRDGNRTTNNPENNVGDHSKFAAVLVCECPRLKCSVDMTTEGLNIY